MSIMAQPFEFATAVYLTRIENQRALNIAELLECLDQASDAAIFFHTSLRRGNLLVARVLAPASDPAVSVSSLD
jgi:hypothetical protein